MSEHSRINPKSLIDKKFLDIPFALKGFSFDGADCIGLSILYFKELGIEYQYDDGFGPIAEHWYEHAPQRLVNAILQIGRVIPWPNLRKFDVILIFGESSNARFPTGAGLMVDDRHFLTTGPGHSSNVYMLNEHWKNAFWGALRLNKVVDKGLSEWE